MQEQKQMLSKYQEPSFKTEDQAIKLEWEIPFPSDWDAVLYLVISATFSPVKKAKLVMV